MPDLDLDAIKASVDKAHQEIGEIAEQGVTRRWRMHIPAQPDRDSDLIISRALTGVDALLAEVKRLRALEQQVLALADRSKVARDAWTQQCAELGIAGRVA